MSDFFRDCQECGAKCCKFFGVPAEYENDIRNQGVPLKKYDPCLEHHPEDYFKLHEGVTVRNERFVIAPEVRTLRKTCRLGKYLIVYSQCRKLDKDGRCMIYNKRPDMCRNFVARTAESYLVPSGCIFDHCGLGEDFGI